MALNHSVADLLQKDRVFYHFDAITKIPRSSFHEKKISDFLVQFGKQLQFEVEQDEFFNVLIKKPASTNKQDLDPIIIQAHLDMVCEKNPNIVHDFSTDAISYYIDDDVISTHNQTTLGADNGIGIAIAMALLEDQSISHPPLHVIFTTAEEEDMSGALNIPMHWIQTHQLINLDHVNDQEVMAGSAGGKGCELSIPVEYISTQPTQKAVTIEIGHLQGGHSGEDIHRLRANAIILMGQLM